MRYHLDLDKIPRSVDRTEWKEIWRNKRVKIKELAHQENEMRNRLRDKSLPSYVRKDIMEHLIYPPILLGPYQ